MTLAELDAMIAGDPGGTMREARRLGRGLNGPTSKSTQRASLRRGRSFALKEPC